jgi:4-hydroxy-tetrahydrodipicolinate reductase
MIRIAISGAAGRMGRRIAAITAGDARFQLVAATEAPSHPALGSDLGEVAGIGALGVEVSCEAHDFDVMVDFSTPNGAMAALDAAIDENAAIVSGTTGLSENQMGRLRKASEGIGVFYASNFSIGIAALRRIASELATLLPNADIEIVEAHHRDKVDSPSGTAIDLARSIAEARGATIENVARFGRNGAVGPRRDEEIGIHSVRGGGIVGDHRGIFALPNEVIAIEHRAISRDLFASGALDAVAFIFGKIGFYGIQDLLST